MEIYVGNFDYSTTERELEKLFSVHGTVDTVHIVTDHYTRQSKCFGYIEMQRTRDGEKAIKMLNGSGLAESRLVVKKVSPLPCREPQQPLTS